MRVRRCRVVVINDFTIFANWKIVISSLDRHKFSDLNIKLVLGQ